MGRHEHHLRLVLAHQQWRGGPLEKKNALSSSKNQSGPENRDRESFISFCISRVNSDCEA